MIDTKSVVLRKLEQLLKRLCSQYTPNTRLLQADIESLLANGKSSTTSSVSGTGAGRGQGPREAARTVHRSARAGLYADV